MKTNILCQVQRRANGIAIAVGAIALAAITLVTSGCATSNTAAAHNAQGVERFTSGQYDDAIALFQASLEENPDSAETYYNLGSAYQRKAAQTGDLKLLDQAEDAYWTALDLNPAPETIVLVKSLRIFGAITAMTTYPTIKKKETKIAGQ